MFPFHTESVQLTHLPHVSKRVIATSVNQICQLFYCFGLVVLVTKVMTRDRGATLRLGGGGEGGGAPLVTQY